MRSKICCLIAILLIIQPFTICAHADEPHKDDAYSLSAAEHWFVPENIAGAIAAENGLLDGMPVNDSFAKVGCDNTFSIEFTPEESGEYEIALSARAPDSMISLDILMDVSLNAEPSQVVQFQPLWYDTGKAETDRRGDEISPAQAALDEFAVSPLLSYTDLSRRYACWTLTAAEHYTFTFSPTIQNLEIETVIISFKESPMQYASADKQAGALPLITIEGEEYAFKSDSYIRAGAVRNAALYPYNTYNKRLNVLDGSSWKTAGQKIVWEFEAEKSGYYRLALRCKQNGETNKSVYRRIEIDGKVPFDIWENARVDYTSSSGYENITFSDSGEDTLIYLEKGKHTIGMTVTAGAYADIYQKIYDLMMEIDELGLLLLRMTAGSTDKNRTWDMNTYMPDAEDRISGYADRADEIYRDLEAIEGLEPVYAMELETVSDKLRDLLKTPETIPNKTEELFRGDTSASKYLGSVLSKLSGHGLSVDRIYFYGSGELPGAKVSFFVSAWESIKRFFWSFLPDTVAEYNISDKGKSEELNVWVNQSAIITDILQRIVDEGYNKQYNANVKLVVMPSEQKLVLANAAGENPDVVLCAPAGLSYTFASRGALKNLLEYEDFLSFYHSQYQIESLLSTAYGDGVYGAVDSRNFQLLFYRKDILSSLGLSAPDTWDDVRAMMPTLLRNQMNFYIPISNSSSLKGLGTTSPFIYQNGGEIYATNGLTTAIQSPESINAISEMTEFYRIYGMQTTVSSFYNSFRYGEVPVGIGDFNMYLQMSMAAPELAGQWDVSLCPGTRQENGEVLRYQPANATASFIFENTQLADEAWQFLHWWLGSETQLAFSTRRSQTFGPEYQWNTANQTAFAQLPFDSRVKALAMEQWEHQREVTPHPAAYIVEREISAVWNDVVIDNSAMIESLDRAVLSINREIRRKLLEFGYIDEQGKTVKDYNARTIEMLYEKLKEE